LLEWQATLLAENIDIAARLAIGFLPAASDFIISVLPLSVNADAFWVRRRRLEIQRAKNAKRGGIHPEVALLVKVDRADVILEVLLCARLVIRPKEQT